MSARALVLLLLVACQRETKVAPPAGNCPEVAESLASIELGNYAPKEQRTALVDKYRAACEKAIVSKDEQACIAQAKSKFEAQRCAVRMFPELGGGRSDCEGVTAKVRAMMLLTMEKAGAANTAQIDQMMPAVRESCEQDGWPSEFKQCIAAAPVENSGMDTCLAQLPKAVQDKLQERLIKTQQQPDR